MLINYNTYLRNKLNINYEIIIFNLFEKLEKIKIFKNIICYELNYKNNEIYLNFIENNINYLISYELFYNLLLIICNYINKEYNLKYELIIFNKTNKYNFYECNLYFNYDYKENIIKEI